MANSSNHTLESEPIGNIRAVCGEHGRTGRYTHHPSGWFVGKLVKVGFHFSGTNRELMWVKVNKITTEVDGRCVGTLDNDPHYVDYLYSGDEVMFWPADVIDVHHVKGSEEE